MSTRDLDGQSKSLLQRQRVPEHVERRQIPPDPSKAKDAEKPEELVPADEQDLEEESHYMQIYNEAERVKTLSSAMQNQIAKKLKNYSVEPKEKTNELLDAEERLFGTRTGVVTYGMYRTCLEIIGKQSEAFAEKAAVTPDKILGAVGGDPEKVLTDAGVAAFSNFSNVVDLDINDFIPLDDSSDMAKMEQEWLPILIKMALGFLDGGTGILEQTIGALVDEGGS